MTANKKKTEDQAEKRLAYTTNPAGFNPFADLFSGNKEKEDTGQSDKSVAVRIVLEKKGRGGKTASIVKGLEYSDRELSDLASQLKNYCGTGGSAKEGQIIIQGDQRNKIIDFLTIKGFNNVKKSGG